MARVSKVGEIYCCTVCETVGSSLTLAVRVDERALPRDFMATGCVRRRRKKILRDLKARGWYVWRRQGYTQCMCPECLLKARNGQDGLRLTESGPGGILGEGAGMAKYVNVEREGFHSVGRMTSVALEKCLYNYRRSGSKSVDT